MEFLEKPQFRGIVKSPIPKDKVSRELLLKEVADMLVKSAIRRVPYNPQEGFYSRIFLAPKKNGKWRPVINLRPLNQFLKKQHFKMSTPAEVIQEVEEGDWLVSIDLKDAYFHVPIHPSHWKFLRFCVGEEAYEFKVLPFGITTAPRVFTKMLAPVAEYVRREIGLYTSPYLDDFLAKDKEKSFLVLQIQGNGSVYAGRGSQNQLGEVGTSSVPGHSPHRPKTYDGFRNSVGAGRSGGGDYTVGQVSPEGDEGVSTAVSQAPGMPEQCHISSGMGQVVFATNPALSPGVLEAQFGNVGRFHSGVEPPKGTPELVEKPKGIWRRGCR